MLSMAVMNRGERNHCDSKKPYFCKLRLMQHKLKHMKKRYFLGLAGLVLAAQVNAQSLVPINGTFYMQGDPNTLMQAHVGIHNTAPSALDVEVVRSVNNLAPNHFSYFCWGVTCYGPGTSWAPAENIMTGATDTSFLGYLNPAGNAGISSVIYCFYDVNNQQDSICLEFVYDATTTGIGELGNDGVSLSGPKPNPATTFTQISYNAGAGASDVSIVLNNMLGAKVRELKMSRTHDLILLGTQALKPGLYFYSLVVDNQVVATKKLVVAGRN